MDIFTLAVWIIILYVIYILSDTVSSLQKEIKEMRIKCIKNIHKNDFTKMNEPSTRVPKNDLTERSKMIKSYLFTS